MSSVLSLLHHTFIFYETPAPSAAVDKKFEVITHNIGRFLGRHLMLGVGVALADIGMVVLGKNRFLWLITKIYLVSLVAWLPIFTYVYHKEYKARIIHDTAWFTEQLKDYSFLACSLGALTDYRAVKIPLVTAAVTNFVLAKFFAKQASFLQ